MGVVIGDVTDKGVPAVSVIIALLPSELLPPERLDDPAGSPLAIAGEQGVRAMFLLLLVSMSSVLFRFRRAGPVEGQQLKWFLLAAVVNGIVVGVNQLPFQPATNPVWAVVDATTFALIPAAVGIAVLRYRLYEIDRIISRTVTYSLLTAALLVVYVSVVAVLGQLGGFTAASELSVVAVTLVVAALFNPLRRRLQAAVDWRFDRVRYDAVHAVDTFVARLRDQVDLDEMTTGLADTDAATVAPTRMGLWLRELPVEPASEAAGTRTG